MTPLSVGHVFMSYSRKDKDVMQRTVVSLRQQGIKVWVDNEKLIPGTPIWEEEIEKAIKGASAVVVILSPDAKNSEWVRREISLADQNRKRIFPVLVRGDEDSSISLRLITRQFVDLRENEKAGLASLHDALSGYLNEEDIQGQAEKVVIKETAILETEKTTTSHPANQMLPWFTLAWAVGGLFSGLIYNSINGEVTGEIIGGTMGGAFGGAIGGFVTAIVLRNKKVLSGQRNVIRVILGWAISGAIGWLIGWQLTEASGAGIGMAIFAIGGLLSTLGSDYIRSNWKSIATITLAWAVGGAIGWSISKGMIDSLGIDNATSWAFGTLVGWGIAGLVMGWQLLKKDITS